MLNNPLIRIFLGGDALIARPWSKQSDPRFLELIQSMRQADVTVINLETSFHQLRGHAQADSGGVYLSASPLIAAELKWAGVDLLAHANNHAYDFGVEGVLETHLHVTAMGIQIAGSGRDLEGALQAVRHPTPGGEVSLLATTSTFIPYGRASQSRGRVPGRPGVNPLAVETGFRAEVTPRVARWMSRISKLIGFSGSRFRMRRFRVGPAGFVVGAKNSLRWRRSYRVIDWERNLRQIERAARETDVLIVSVHDHRPGPLLRSFARAALDRGAAIVFCHGPHRVGGIEIYRGKPVLYGLGSLVFEPHFVKDQPADLFESLNLPEDAEEEQLNEAFSWLHERPETWQGIGVRVTFEGSAVTEMELIPLDLGLNLEFGLRGRPVWAEGAAAEQIIGEMARRSSRYGTRIDFSREQNIGRVRL